MRSYRGGGELGSTFLLEDMPIGPNDCEEKGSNLRISLFDLLPLLITRQT